MVGVMRIRSLGDLRFGSTTEVVGGPGYDRSTIESRPNAELFQVFLLECLQNPIAAGSHSALSP